MISFFEKAAWGGHIALIRYLRDEHGLIDKEQDDAGNFAADLADMAHTPKHTKVANFLREQCSEERQISCRILGVDVNASRDEIRQAYLKKALLLHPDRLVVKKRNELKSTDCDKDSNHENLQRSDFDTIKKAYDHLTINNGIGTQSNPSHCINLMLTINSKNQHMNSEGETENREIEMNSNSSERDVFKARLMAVVLEYGDKGLALCNIKKKWKQVWPTVDFPSTDNLRRHVDSGTRKKGRLAQYIEMNAGDVVELRYEDDGNGCIVVPKFCRRKDILLASSEKKEM